MDGLLLRFPSAGEASVLRALDEARQDEVRAARALRGQFVELAEDGSGTWRSVPDALRQDRSFLAAAVEEDSCRWVFVSEAMKKDAAFQRAAPSAERRFWTAEVQRDASRFRNLPEALRMDFGISLAAVRSDCQSWRMLPDALKADEAFRAEAVEEERAFWVTAVAKTGTLLLQAPLSVRSHPDVAIAAVNSDFRAWKYVPEELTSDDVFLSASGCAERQFWLSEVERQGRVLEKAPDRVRCLRDVALAAVTQDFKAWKYISDSLHSDADFRSYPAASHAEKQFWLAEVKRDVRSLEAAPEAVRADAEVMLAALRKDHKAWRFVADSLRANRSFSRATADFEKQFWLAEVGRDGKLLQNVPERLRVTKDVSLAAVKKDCHAWSFVPNILKKDSSFVAAAGRAKKQYFAYWLEEVRRDGFRLEQASDEVRLDRDISLAAVKKEYRAWPFVPDALKADLDFQKAAAAVEKQFWLSEVESVGLCYKDAPLHICEDGEVALAAVTNNSEAWNFVPEKLQKSASGSLEKSYWFKEIRTTAIKFGDAPIHIRSNKDAAREAIEADCLAWRFVPDELRQDADFMAIAAGPQRQFWLAEVQSSGRLLQNAPDEIKRDRDIVLAALGNEFQSWRFVPEFLKNDQDFMLAAELPRRQFVLFWVSGIICDGFRYDSAPDDMKAEREVAMAAVFADCKVWRAVPDALKFEKRFRSEAAGPEKQFWLLEVRRRGKLFESMPGDLQGDKEIALVAVEQDCQVWRNLPESLMRDEGFLCAATVAEQKFWLEEVRREGRLLSEAPPRIKANQTVALAAVNQDCRAWAALPDTLRYDSGFLVDADVAKKRYIMHWISEVGRIGRLLGNAPDDIRSDKEVALAAVTNDCEAWRFVPNALRVDPGFRSSTKDAEKRFWLAEVQCRQGALEDAPEDMRGDQDVAVAAANYDHHAWRHIPDTLKKDLDFTNATSQARQSGMQYWLSEVQRDGLRLEMVPSDMREDRGIAIAAVTNNFHALAFAPELLKKDKEFTAATARAKKQFTMYWVEEVRRDGLRFEAAPRDLQADRTVAMAAVLTDYRAWVWVPEELQQDKDLKAIGSHTEKQHWLAEVERQGRTLEAAPAHVRADRDVAMSAVQNDFLAWAFIGDPLRAELHFTSQAAPFRKLYVRHCVSEVRADGMLLETVASDVRCEPAVAFAAVNQNIQAWQFVPPMILKDMEFMAAAAASRKQYLQFWLLKVERNGRLFKDLPVDVQEDQMVAFAAVSDNWSAWRFVPESLKANRDFARRLPTAERRFWLDEVQRCGLNLEKAPCHIQSDAEIARVAVVADFKAWAFVPCTLKANAEFADATERCKKRYTWFWLEEVRKDGMLLRDALEEIRSDPEVARAAVLQTFHAWSAVPDVLKSDPEFLSKNSFARKQFFEHWISEAKRDPRLLETAPSDAREDKEVSLAAVFSNFHAWRFVPVSLKRDEAFAQATATAREQYFQFWLSKVQRNGRLLETAPNEVRADKTISLAAVINDPTVWRAVPQSLRKDKELMILIDRAKRDGGGSCARSRPVSKAFR